MGKNKLEQLKERYEEFYKSFLKQGQLPMRDTKLGFWGVAHTNDLVEIFKKIEINKHKTFLDLGSGDGKAALIAALFGLKATGIEIDEELVKISKRFQKELNIKNAEFLCEDFLQHDISKYEIIFVNPDKEFHHGLEEKLLKELKGILIVYNVVFRPTRLKKGRTYWVNQIPATVYTKK